jgi:hypothetical protein
LHRQIPEGSPPLLRPPSPLGYNEADAVRSALSVASKRLTGAASAHLQERREFAGQPGRYFRDRLGWVLTDQQESILELVLRHDRVLVPAANGVGKTFVLAGLGLYYFEVIASLPDPERGLPEQGCRLLLLAPDARGVFATIYSEMMQHAARAEERGFPMPGDRSERSVTWSVRPQWAVEAFSPPRRVGQNVRHGASGRHHKNQIALVEEGLGVDDPTWRAVEGMCSSHGNKIISSFNPTEPAGSAYQRASDGSYVVLHLDAFDHPNIARRHFVVPEAISYAVVDARVRSQCQDRGPWPATTPDSEFDDFLYALPPLDHPPPERGPREDGVPGHPDCEVRVFRPGPTFQAQVRGQWPRTLESGLINPADWDAGVRRYRAALPPSGHPDQVGADLARDGGDEIIAMPRWGSNPDTVLRLYAAAQRTGNVKRMREIERDLQIYCGEPVMLPRGDGPTVARLLKKRWTSSPFVVDESGVGASVLDHLKQVLSARVDGVSFAASAPTPGPGEPYTENLRAFMYVRAATLLRLGLISVPPDPMLREEMLATDVLYVRRTVDVPDGMTTRKEVVMSIRIQEKDEIKKKIGRSPDRADAFVVSLYSGRPQIKGKPQRKMRW